MSSILNSWRAKASRALNELAAAESRLQADRSELQERQEHLSAVQEAQQLVQEVAQAVQTYAYQQIAGVVSKCLEAVFEEPYKLRMDFVQKRGRTEVELSFDRDGLQVDPLTASGGGVVDVASFALRLASLLLSKPPLRRLLVLDEPFKFVSAGYRGRVREMLETLAEELGVQILMVTHIEELKTGKVIEL